jgi:hypothetical protein
MIDVLLLKKFVLKYQINASKGKPVPQNIESFNQEMNYYDVIKSNNNQFNQIIDYIAGY